MFRPVPTATAIALCAGLLSACSHGIEMQPLDGGPPGIGDASIRGRKMSVRLDGKRYAGDFVHASAAEVAHVDSPFPAQGPVATGRYWGVQGKNGATGVVLAAKDGSTIACKLDWDSPAHIGSGLCRGEDGRSFSLRIY